MITRTSIAVCGALVAALLVFTAPAAMSIDQEPELRVRYDPAIGTPRAVTAADGSLTEASSRAAGDIALDWLGRHQDLYRLTDDELETFSVGSSLVSEGTGGTTVVLAQTVRDVRIDGSGLLFTFTPAGELVFVGGPYEDDPYLTAGVTISPATATSSAIAAGGGDGSVHLPVVSQAGNVTVFDNLAAPTLADPSDHRTELVIYPMTPLVNTFAYRVQVELSNDVWNDVVVDALTGTVLHSQSLYSHSDPEGRVFTGEHPDADNTRSVVTFPTGWVTNEDTTGNNVVAYEDRDADNAPDAGSSPNPGASGGTSKHFDYTFVDAYRDGVPPGTPAGEDVDTDRDATLTQLYYYTNLVHDFLYDLGFTEQWRNFQVDNFGKGGAGGDPVNAEARDGWGTGTEEYCTNRDGDPVKCRNNANFGTPADGDSPRMQMYMWSGSRPFRDGSLDGDVIAHEYGHGLSNRLVGNGNLGSGKQTGSLGEGWSDTVSWMMWDDTRVAEYVTGNATRGIRSTAYDTSTLVYSDFDNAVGVHANGEIWSTVNYNLLQALRGRYGHDLGMAKLRQLVVDGMKNTPSSPTFVDARDGVLAAEAASGNDDYCVLWVQFAERELGTGAAGTATTATPDSTLPSECAPTADAGGPYSTDEGTGVPLSAIASNDASHHSSGGIASYDWDFDDDGVFDDATGASPTFTSVGDNGVYPVSVRVTTDAGATDEASTTVTVDNVDPTTSIAAGQATDMLEGAVLDVTAMFGDPGWLDTYTASVDWGTGAAAEPASVVVTGDGSYGTPDTGTATASHQYGDNGTYTVTVTVSDDDGGSDSASFEVSVLNVAPTVAIDESGSDDVNGTPTIFTPVGEEVAFSANVTDPGSDDLEVFWDWDDGAPSPDESEDSQVNPPDDDPAQSPSVQPRDVIFSTAHTFDGACLYEVEATADDDDGGSDSDTITVVVVGDTEQIRGTGYWFNQYDTPGQRNVNDLTDERLDCYLAIVNHYSGVFGETRSLASQAEAAEVLKPRGRSNRQATVKLDSQLVGAWFNFASGAILPDELVDTDGDGVADTGFLDVLTAAEAVRNDPGASRQALIAQKDLLESIISSDT